MSLAISKHGHVYRDRPGRIHMQLGSRDNPTVQPHPLLHSSLTSTVRLYDAYLCFTSYLCA